MKKYRKRPVVIEATQLTEENGQEIARWCNGLWCMLKTTTGQPGKGFPFLLIPTLEGDMEARPGDFIIEGINGEFYPCKPDIFEKTYEPVDE
jgi:hypothetical protein